MGIIPAGLLRGGGNIYGVPMYIEVKTGRDTLRPEQVGFLKTAAKMGAITLIVKDFQDFKAQWQSLVSSERSEII